uniref:Proliferating cell nuclear antigen PCNA N-terminal domain-containing protein n=1 Tax=viral metagenome TaxID=1070528 RepID=A0A6C0CB45_9ZZZZ
MSKNIQKNHKPQRILEVRTSQTGVLKQVFERISTVISDCCIVFIPPDKTFDQSQDDDYYEKIDANPTNERKKRKKNLVEKNTAKKACGGGIRILRLTEDKSVLIKLALDSDKFDYFMCTEPKIKIGVDINQLHAMLKMINDDEPIIFYMNKDNMNRLYINSVAKNNDGSEETDIELFLMDISNPELQIPQTEFQNIITIASDKFHTDCKHFNNNTRIVEIISINDQISFKGISDAGHITKTYKDIHGAKNPSKNVVVQGRYELKNLLSFSKCNKLCNTIDIYLKNDFPLVLVIAIATLGKMYVFLTPIEEETNKEKN